jgi:hypothetical protein
VRWRSTGSRCRSALPAAPSAGHGGRVGSASTRRVVRCPIRPGEPCTLCQLDVTGPQYCGLVYLVMHNPELREGLRRFTNTTHSTRP